MSIYRFLLKIPLQIYFIAFLSLALLAHYSFPLTEISNDGSTFYLASLLHESVSKLAELSNINLSIFIRLTGLLTVIIFIYVNIKIIKFKFYDLKFLHPIIATLYTGPILFSLILDIKYLISGLLTLVIFFFQSKYLENKKIYDLIFLCIFSLLALSFNNYYFLIVITILAIFKIFNLSISKQEIINIISQLILFYLVFFVFLIINLMNQTSDFFNLDLNFNAIIKKIFNLFFMYLSLIGFFINSLFFNIFKKINWNKDLIMFLIIGSSSITIYLITDSNNLSPLIFGFSIIGIYIFRTLEFIEFRRAKIFHLILLLLPISVIIFDISLYKTMDAIPYINFVFYLALIVFGLINPFFYFEKLSSVEILKISLFSLYVNALLTFCFILFQYKNYYTLEVIRSSIETEFNCQLETTRIIIEIIDLEDSPNYFINKGEQPNNTCEILVKLSNLDNILIDNQESLNKTGLDLQLKKFININLSKI